MALDDETTLTGGSFPLHGTPHQVTIPGPLAVPQVPFGASVASSVLTGGEDTLVAGIATMNVTITSTAPDTTLYFSLRIASRGAADPMEAYVNDQVIPLRIAGPVVGQTYGLELGGIATRLGAGETLELHVSNWEPMYFANAGRTPGAVVVEDIVLDLPVLT